MMRGAFLRFIAASGLVLLSINAGFAASRDVESDWPCPQRFVPNLTAALFWAEPSVEKFGNWRQEPKVTELVRKISPRKVTAEEGEALIATFASGLKENRARLITLAFLGLLEETNRQRTEIMDRIKTLERRQRALAEIATRASDELHELPNDATGETAERREDLELRRRYVTKAFDDGQRTIRYACEVPVQIEARLGAYARALQHALS